MVGPVYHITCDDCDAMYVGEMERSLKTRFLEHPRKISVGSEVLTICTCGCTCGYVDRPEHGVSLDRVKILTVNNMKFERGV